MNALVTFLPLIDINYITITRLQRDKVTKRVFDLIF